MTSRSKLPPTNCRRHNKESAPCQGKPTEPFWGKITEGSHYQAVMFSLGPVKVFPTSCFLVTSETVLYKNNIPGDLPCISPRLEIHIVSYEFPTTEHFRDNTDPSII